jgi:nucleotide-binding universal stress UspA family protein
MEVKATAAAGRLYLRSTATGMRAVAYKTVLVHCNDKRRIRTLLAPVMRLAEQTQAHLIGLAVAPPVTVIPTGVPGAPDTMVVDEHRTAFRAELPAMKAVFDGAALDRGCVAEWREEDAGDSSVADRVLPYARAADLVAASQDDADWTGSGFLDVGERLVMESGRPVLVVPNAGTFENIGERVLVAWNARREAVRATFDALPILARAKQVRVVWVNPQSARETAQDIPAADICDALARHGVNCEATEQVAPRGAGVGETLAGCARDFGADLMVMGCYGHSRMRELVFGGASRHVLSRMTLPVLMSH